VGCFLKKNGFLSTLTQIHNFATVVQLQPPGRFKGSMHYFSGLIDLMQSNVLAVVPLH